MILAADGIRSGICARCAVEHYRVTPTRVQSYCPACHAQYMREHRPVYGELSIEDKRRSNVRSYANVYQRRGKLKPQPCEVCGSPAQKHHDDYGKRLQFRWLCVAHHVEFHRLGVVEHSRTFVPKKHGVPRRSREATRLRRIVEARLRERRIT